MQYRRAALKGGTYFFTLVTYQRRHILCEPDNVALLREVFRAVMAHHPLTIDAFVLLPDHLHCIWTLPQADHDFSTRWRLIKSAFSRRCQPKYTQRPSASRLRKGEQAVWQRRFWEHTIRDDKDLKQHVEYIHYNPVKHGLAGAPKDWEFSSFHRYVREGVYDIRWGETEGINFVAGIGHE